jgi:hypothetical protein
VRVRRVPPGVRRVLLASSAIVLLAPAGAAAHGTVPHGTATPGAERALRRSEERTLGPRHAAEHAAQRAALRRWAALPAAAKERARTRGRRAATRATAAAGPADQVGRWSPTRIDMPTWAINAALLPTGKVAYWGRGAARPGGPRANTAPFYLWDPATGTSERFDPPNETIDLDGDGQADDIAPAPLFCSGQSLLPSGELFVAGGNAFYPAYGAGHKDYGGWSGTYSFDPWAERWTIQPRMTHGRWYPTQVELPDGRIGIASGYDERGDGDDNPEFEVFTPAATRGARGTMRSSVAAERLTAGFYPHMQVLPGGRLAYVGQHRGDTRTLDPAALFPGGSPAAGSAWTDGADTRSFARVGGSAALLPGTSRMMFLGGYGWDWDDGSTAGRAFAPASRTVETTDFAAPAAQWSTGGAGDVPDLDRARSYGTLVQLPDGGFAYVGGAGGFDGTANGAGNNATQGDQALKTVALWKPGQAGWTTGPAQAKWRGYHSTAVLLPDGRVLSAGDDYWGTDDTPHQEAESPQDQGEIYEPAYLFDGTAKAPRPSITSAPSAVGWGATFGIGTQEVPGRRIVRATLVAPTAVTHAVDMNRGLTDLRVVERTGGGVTLQAPSGPDLAPPGWYMLFAWDETGTPSIARWVQLTGPVPQPPTQPPGQPPTQPPGGPGTPPDTPPVPVVPPGRPARDTVGPRAALALRRPVRNARVLRLRVGADEPGRITVTWRVRKERARTGTVRLRTSRLSGELRLPLSKAARRILRSGRVLRVVLRSTATDTAGNVSRRTVTVRLRPRGR